MDKPTMLLISQSSTTNVGMRSYLNHIFSKYIHLETCLAADADTERMEKADLVLFSSRSAARMAEPLMTPKIRYLICIRTFNHTYLNRILSIPSNSEVYLVNDSEASARDSIQLLYTLGITQYRFIPYYPGCPETDARIQYAVTVGENKLAPRNVQTLVDIGIRIADISTISEIASFFHLPLSLTDVVSLNYINQFVQLLKISNHQLSQATNTKFITQSIISNIDTGICIVDEEGKIQMPDVRFIASTEEDLYTMCQEGRFLKSLFYMIGEVSLETFPIRQRPEDIPLLFEYFIRNIYNNSALRWTDMCSEELWNSLTAYSWPGNGKEIENLCKYVYCFHSEGKLTIRDLPAYIRLQMAKKTSLLSPLEKRVLQTVAQNPKTGRAGLQEILENEGIQVAEGKIRSILQSLSEQGLIKVNRTRGGCEITETGELQLE